MRGWMLRRSWGRLLLVALVTVVALVAVGSANAPVPRYTVLDLGLGLASAISDSGVVVGLLLPTHHAFRYDDGTAADLGTLPGDLQSNATAINNRGQIVGISQPTDTSFGHAVIWNGDEIRDLGTLGGGSDARAINNRGDVVGATHLGSVSPRGFIYRDGQMSELPLSFAYDINDRGDIIGTEIDGLRAVLYRAGGLTYLGTLGGTGTQPTAINARGQIVGGSNLAGNTAVHAFLYQDGAMLDLGALQTGNGSQAQAINDRGQIVGYSNIVPGHGRTHAFLYEHGQMIDLIDLLPDSSGWELSFALGINNRGQIVGTGNLNGEGNHMFLLTPIEEE